MKFFKQISHLTLFTGLFLLNQPASAQVLTENQTDSLANRVLKQFKVPGLAVGIIKDGRLIYSKGFGVRSLQTKKPVDGKTLFGIASNTKAFTAAALALLVDDGKLHWDDKVTQYIREFKMYDAYATREMTIRDLLCHRSGLGTGVGDLMHDPDSTSFTVNEIIYNLRYLKPDYSFRSKFAYDNNLYLVAGEVIARVAKMPWENFVEQRILKPLGMSSSAASYNGVRQSENIIDPHRTVNDTAKLITRYTSTKDDAAGGVYSNIEDLSKWMRMLINNGKYGPNLEKRLLSEQVMKDFFAAQTIIPVGNPGAYGTHFAAYGLGWFLTDTKGYKLVLHTGEDVGMVSEVAMIPELGLGIVVLTNNESNAIDAITYQIMDGYLGISGIDETARSLGRLKASEQSAAKQKAEIWKAASTQKLPADFKKYAGVYHDQWFGNITVSIRNKQLWFAAQRSPQLRGWLQPYQQDMFLIKWQNPEVDADAFVMFKPGKVQQITLKSAVPSAGYSFNDLLFKKLKEK